ncbi:MAG TPA: hypothetical protein QF606_06260, partial [Anaerolineales bacterium]|nr:hypothetical protein [Anaerolineales bacterium]
HGQVRKQMVVDCPFGNHQHRHGIAEGSRAAHCGDVHFKVQKEVSGERTSTTVYPLDDNSRVEEIVDMLGGQNESVRETALSLLSTAATDKNVGTAA